MLVAILGLSLCESGLEASEDGDVDGMSAVLGGVFISEGLEEIRE